MASSRDRAREWPLRRFRHQLPIGSADMDLDRCRWRKSKPAWRDRRGTFCLSRAAAREAASKSNPAQAAGAMLQYSGCPEQSFAR